MTVIASHGIGVVADLPPPARRRIEEFHDFVAFVEQVVSDAHPAQYVAERDAARPPPSRHRPPAPGLERTGMTSIIRTERLTKAYGPHRGIIDVDLEVSEGEVFGFLGPNGAGKTTTIRTLLDLIRPTSGRAFVFDIETTVDPVAIHRRIGYIPGEFALYDRLTGGQTIQYFANLRGGVDAAYQASLIERLDIDPTPQVQGALEGQQAEDRPRDRAPAPAGAADPRRADVRPRPARPADLLRASSARRAAEGRSVFLSSHILSEVERTCDRVAIIRDGVLVKVDRVEALRDLAHHQVELRFVDAVPAAAFAGLPGVSDVERRGPHAAPARLRADHARRPGGRPLRAARLREPRAEPRGDVPRPVRPARPTEVAVMTAVGQARRRRACRPRPGRGAGSTASGTVYAKTLRDSRLAVIIVVGHDRGRSCCPAAPPSARPTRPPQSRQELANLVSSLPPVMSGVYGNPFPADIETLGGSIGWKSGASLALIAALWSILALSGTLAAEARRGSLEFVATTPLGMRRIAVEKVFAHLTGMAIVVLVTGVHRVRGRRRVRHAAGRRDLVPVGRRLRDLGRRRRARLGLPSRSRSRRSSAAARPPGSPARSSLVGYFVNGYQAAVPAFAALANLTWWGWTAHHQPLAGQFDWVDAHPGRRSSRSSCSSSASSCSRGATSA